ncbi:HEPN domain-containing protein [Murimonas intestini]|nr:HEPN domain-containing protein [Murimonas intestini]
MYRKRVFRLPEYSSLQKDYAKYRIERAKEDLEAAYLLFNSGNYRIANNRAYYTVFHAMRAVLVFDNFDSSKHSGVIAEFRRRYIKEGVFPIEVSKMIGSAFTIRNASDYDDMFLASRSDTEEQIANAEYIFRLLSKYIEELLKE